MKKSNSNKKKIISGSNRAVVSGNKTAINRANREWLRFRSNASYLYSCGAIKDKKLMVLIKFVFLSGYDSAILNDENNNL